MGASARRCSAQQAMTKVKVFPGSANVMREFIFVLAANTDTRLLQGGPQGVGSSCGVQEAIQCFCY